MLVMCTSRFAESDRRQHLVEQLAGAPDERLALHVLVAPRRLADDHDARFGRAAVEAQVLGRRLEAAAVEGLQRRLELVEALRRSRRRARRQFGGIRRGAGELSRRTAAGIWVGAARGGCCGRGSPRRLRRGGSAASRAGRSRPRAGSTLAPAQALAAGQSGVLVERQTEVRGRAGRRRARASRWPASPRPPFDAHGPVPIEQEGECADVASACMKRSLAARGRICTFAAKGCPR